MKKIELIAIVFVLFVFAGCSPKFIIDNDYRGHDFSEETLMLQPLKSQQIHVLNQDDYVDDIPDISKDSLRNLMNSIFVATSEEYGRNAKIFMPEDNEANRSRLMEWNGMVGDHDVFVTVYRPTMIDGKKPRFGMFFNELTFDRIVETYYNAGPPGGMGTTTSSSSLQINAQYVIWDYQERKPVAYGKAKGKEGFAFVMSREDWFEVMEDFFITAIRQTPFAK